MKYLLTALACLFVSHHARANDDQKFVPPGISLQKIFTLANDHDANVDRFNLMIDEQKHAAGVILNAGNRDETDNTAHDTPYLFRDIARPEGVVLVEGQGRKVVIMQGTLNRDTEEGRFKLSYLANGLSGKYESCDVQLKKDANGWYAQNVYTNQKITSVKIITWSLGLKTLQGICPHYFSVAHLR